MADDVPEHLKEIIQIRTQQVKKLSEELRMTPNTSPSWAQLDGDIESIEKEIERLKNSRTYEQFGRHPSADAAHNLGEGIGKGNLRDLRDRYRDVEDAIGSPHHRAVVENLDPRLRQVLEAEGGEAFRVMPRYLQHSPPETQKLFADVLERTEPSYIDVGFPQGQMDDPSWTRTFIQGNTPAVNITLTPGHGGSAEVLNMENIAKPGQARGAGRSFLQEITDLADKNQANMTLTAAPYSSGRGGRVDRSRLQQMYGDLGFEEYRSIGAVGNDSPGMVPLRQNDIYPMVREPRPADPPGAAGVFERQRRKREAGRGEATPELTPEMKAEEQRVRELRQTIYEQDRRLSDLNPDSPAAWDAKRKKSAAKALLRGMGRLAVVATPLATLYEGVAYAQDVADEGPVGGTRKYVGEGIEGTGALASGVESLTERETLEEMMGYPTSPTTRAMRFGGDVVGAIGKGLGYLGRAIVGSDEEEEEEIPIAVNPSDPGTEDPIRGTPAEMRREAARRAVARERARKE